MSAKLILKEIGTSLFGKDKKDEINRQMALIWQKFNANLMLFLQGLQ